MKVGHKALSEIDVVNPGGEVAQIQSLWLVAPAAIDYADMHAGRKPVPLAAESRHFSRKE
ncbi:MAG TPA: hypothetical protein VM074_11745 [Solimonas sp.]|nr:hypothetical protein [Solimonas sp.]